MTGGFKKRTLFHRGLRRRIYRFKRSGVLPSVEEEGETQAMSEQTNVDLCPPMLNSTSMDVLFRAGFTTLFPVQAEAITVGMLGFDIMVQAKPGAGRTIIFVLMALESLSEEAGRPQVLIVGTNSEIAAQVISCVETFGSSDIRVGVFMGDCALAEDVEKLKENYSIIVGMASRLRRLVETKALQLSHVRLFVLDEADKMMRNGSEMEIKYLFNALPYEKQVAVFAATYPKRLEYTVLGYMRDVRLISIDMNEESLTVKQYVIVPRFIGDAMKAMQRVLSHLHYYKCIIFVEDYNTCYEVYEELHQANLNVQCLCDCLDLRMQLGNSVVKVLVTTDAIPWETGPLNTNAVISYGSPAFLSTYLHRVRRAETFGTPGIAFAFLRSHADLKKFSAIVAEGQICAKILRVHDSWPSSLIYNEAFFNKSVKFCPYFGITLERNFGRENGSAVMGALKSIKSDKDRFWKAEKRMTTGGRGTSFVLQLSRRYSALDFYNICKDLKECRLSYVVLNRVATLRIRSANPMEQASRSLEIMHNYIARSYCIIENESGSDGRRNVFLDDQDPGPSGVRNQAQSADKINGAKAETANEASEVEVGLGGVKCADQTKSEEGEGPGKASLAEEKGLHEDFFKVGRSDEVNLADPSKVESLDEANFGLSEAEGSVVTNLENLSKVENSDEANLENPLEVGNSDGMNLENPSEAGNSDEVNLENPVEVGNSDGMNLENLSGVGNSDEVNLENPVEVGNSDGMNLENLSEVGNSDEVNLENPVEVGNSDGMNLGNPSGVGNSDEVNLENPLEVGSSDGMNLENSSEVGNLSGVNLEHSPKVGNSNDVNLENSSEVGISNGPNLADPPKVEDSNEANLDHSKVEGSDVANLDNLSTVENSNEANLDGRSEVESPGEANLGNPSGSNGSGVKRGDSGYKVVIGNEVENGSVSSVDLQDQQPESGSADVPGDIDEDTVKRMFRRSRFSFCSNVFFILENNTVHELETNHQERHCEAMQVGENKNSNQSDGNIGGENQNKDENFGNNEHREESDDRDDSEPREDNGDCNSSEHCEGSGDRDNSEHREDNGDCNSSEHCEGSGDRDDSEHRKDNGDCNSSEHCEGSGDRDDSEHRDNSGDCDDNKNCGNRGNSNNDEESVPDMDGQVTGHGCH